MRNPVTLRKIAEGLRRLAETSARGEAARLRELADHYEALAEFLDRPVDPRLFADD